MGYKFDEGAVRMIVYVILHHEEIKGVKPFNNGFNDGGKTRTMVYFGYNDRMGLPLIAAGYPDKKLIYQYNPSNFKDALVGTFFHFLN